MRQPNQPRVSCTTSFSVAPMPTVAVEQPFSSLQMNDCVIIYTEINMSTRRWFKQYFLEEKLEGINYLVNKITTQLEIKCTDLF